MLFKNTLCVFSIVVGFASHAKASDILVTTVTGEAFRSDERIEIHAITNNDNQLGGFRFDTYYREPVPGTRTSRLASISKTVGRALLATETGYGVKVSEVVIPGFARAKEYMKDANEFLYKLVSRNPRGGNIEEPVKLDPKAGGLLKLTIISAVKPAAWMKVEPSEWISRWLQISRNENGKWLMKLYNGSSKTYLDATTLFLCSTKQTFPIVGTHTTGIHKILNQVPDNKYVFCN